MQIRSGVITIGLVLFALAAALDARTPPVWRLERLRVPPPAVDGFETGWRTTLDGLEAVSIAVDDDSVYSFLTPVDTDAPVDADTPLTRARRLLRDDRRADSAGWLLHEAAELAHRPLRGRDPAGVGGYMRYRLLFPIDGYQDRAAELLRARSQLFTRRAIPFGYRAYRAVSGDGLPLFVLVDGAEGAAAYHQQHEAIAQALGDDGLRIDAMLRTVLRRVETRGGRHRSDLSVPGDTGFGAFAGLAPRHLTVPAEPLLPPESEKAERSAPSSDRTPGTTILDAARRWVERGPTYDGSYRLLAYPGGDPGPTIGTGVDLVVRSLRAHGIDLQVAIHEDWIAVPDVYSPRGNAPDRNIDHRRIRNLATWLGRHARSLGTEATDDWRAGDIVLWDTRGDGRPDHVGIVSDRRASDGSPWVVHHFEANPPFGGQPREETVFDLWPRLGHFRIRSSSP